MISCPACSGQIPEARRFCPDCGEPLDFPSAAATQVSPVAGSTSSPRPEPSASHHGRFIPGAMLGGRYRIAGLLGKGGMGEVYRADDLKLGQPVALKLLPEALSGDTSWLEKLYAEVRLSRQVSHPNVCRVYDVGEADAQHFLSMEYVDGEDLASLLRRIGRLPHDKALEIARQLCAGLAAAHDRGVLHRDLKPANIMIDGRGRARITDFGLAALEADVRGGEARAGTPAYMAPEQLAGGEVTGRSDIYSLGLVLYELFTGKPPFEARSIPELIRLQGMTPPVSPSSHMRELDPAVERAILRCLEKDPASRPSSALAVAAALPGGDPLAAALAAGETPSPQMVANAADKGGLAPAAAWACLGIVILGLVVIVRETDRVALVPLVRPPEPPQALAARARETIRSLGYDQPPADTTHGFAHAPEYLEHLAQQMRPGEMRAAIATGAPPALLFWYRESPRFLVPYERNVVSSFEDPPPVVPGMVSVRLDPRGRLRYLQAVPPTLDEALPRPTAPPWPELFARAGFDPASFQPVEPSWNPPAYADTRAAWTGAHPEAPDIPIRIEAASRAGRPVSFRIVYPWTKRPDAAEPDSAWERFLAMLLLWLFVFALVGGSLLALRNLRLGRGDRRGAFRLAAYLLGVRLLIWLLQAHHVPGQAEIEVFSVSLAWALYAFGMVWLYYLALEPYLRRLWPRMLVTWVRLLEGRILDPLVGRDALVGTALGVVFVLLALLRVSSHEWLGLPPPPPDKIGSIHSQLSGMAGTRFALAQVLWVTRNETLEWLTGPMIVLLLLRILLRRTWPAVLVWLTIGTIINLPRSGNQSIAVVFTGISVILAAAVLFRFGMLSLLLALLTAELLAICPPEADLTAWYATPTMISLGLVAGLAIYGFRIILAGRPLLRDLLAEA